MTLLPWLCLLLTPSVISVDTFAIHTSFIDFFRDDYVSKQVLLGNISVCHRICFPLLPYPLVLVMPFVIAAMKDNL